MGRSWARPAIQTHPLSTLAVSTHPSLPCPRPRRTPETHRPGSLAGQGGELTYVQETGEALVICLSASYQTGSQEEFISDHPHPFCSSALVPALSACLFINMCDKPLNANRSFKPNQIVSISLE